MVLDVIIHKSTMSVDVGMEGGSASFKGKGPKFLPKKGRHNVGGCPFINDASMDHQILDYDWNLEGDG